ncbi:TIGR04211 family SH3 domain-containing protein [Ferrimonas kyonanensis]|uniref:TIGR04211 family SH3 domain-containing protein n=1 Tax=Ferrimonas kyonanensis TaxID=364763 RepID=UPI0003F70EB1|nr:TIGR04211 family SH3 domain-containing protein [Ferrimonas kyonanensis]
MRKTLAGSAFLLSLLFAVGAPVKAQEFSISEDIYVYLVAGPGTQFRILGSVSAGTPVTPTGETQGDYVQITDDKGRTGWIKQDQLAQSESFRLAVPRLNQQVDNLQQQLQQQQQQNSQLLSQVEQLNSQLEDGQRAAMNVEADLKTNLDALSIENEQLKRENKSMKNNERWQWLQQGGMVAGGGLLVGLILAYLPRPQRRRKSQGGWV